MPGPDAPNAVLDGEVRARYAALPDAARGKLSAEMEDGAHLHTVIALARDPLPGPFRDCARGIWEGQRRRECADAMGDIADRLEGAAELDASLPSVLNVINS